MIQDINGKKVKPEEALTHKNIVDGWFYETNTLWPGQRLGLQVLQVLHAEQSLFQDILVFKSPKGFFV